MPTPKTEMPALPHYERFELPVIYDERDGAAHLTSVNAGPLNLHVKVIGEDATAFRHAKLFAASPELAAFADDALFQILTFDKKCSEEEYTDTGEAWTLLNHIKDGARKILEKAIKG